MKIRFLFDCFFTAALMSGLNSSCSPCAKEHVKTIEELKNQRKLVAYIRVCGATVDNSSHVEFYESDPNEGKEEVFFGYHSNGILVQKISNDTIKIIYGASEVIEMKKEVDGIHFVYENNPKRIPKKGVTIRESK